MENRSKYFSNWKETKGKLKKQFAILTDDDLLFVEGQQDQLLSRLQQKLNKTKEQIQKLISSL